MLWKLFIENILENAIAFTKTQNPGKRNVSKNEDQVLVACLESQNLRG